MLLLCFVVIVFAVAVLMGGQMLLDLLFVLLLVCAQGLLILGGFWYLYCRATRIPCLVTSKHYFLLMGLGAAWPLAMTIFGSVLPDPLYFVAFGAAL
ncbi:MAG: hypothetical protein MHM6MM_004215 [Cercozoa sp. M6MM]